MVVRFEVDPDHQFAEAVRDAIKKVDDLRIPFGLITKSWFKSNRAIFGLKGPGKYADFKNEKSHKQKLDEVGFDYPLLRRYGFLEKSITQAGDSNSINTIVNRTTLILGSKIPYGPAHQFGTKFMKARPWVLIGAEQTAPPELNVRRELWIKTIQDYVSRVAVAKVGETK